MIDTAFVRANLALVEEKLRARGMDPATVLGDFTAIDRERREAITQVENLKAQRNKLTEEIARLRKSGADASAQTDETRALRTQVEAIEATAAAADLRMTSILESVPNLPQPSVPIGKSEHDNRVEKHWGDPPKFAFTPQASLGTGRSPRHPRLQ